MHDPLDIEQPDAVILEAVDRLWQRLRDVPVGGVKEGLAAATT